MILLDRAALAAMLTLAFAPLAASADPVRTPVVAQIVVRDLDLGSAAGQQAFNARVRRAATAHCGVAGIDLHARLDVLRCRQEMLSDAQVRLASLTSARRIELAASR
jgi:UrcA family protein